MNFLQNIRFKIGNYYFRKDLSIAKREKVITNLPKSKNIGVVYSVGSEKQYLQICDFIKSIQDDRKEVKAIGFINDKLIPHYCYPKIAYDYFTTKNLNWYLKPSNGFVNDFIHKEYDILIDLSIESCFPLQYISGLSKAKFKVGRYGINPLNFYDLMLEVDDKISMDDYLRNIKHYLTVLNSNVNTN